MNMRDLRHEYEGSCRGVGRNFSRGGGGSF